MYPRLCYIDESVAEEKSDIKHIFSEDEYNLITGGERPVLAFKAAEFIEDLF